MVLAKNKLDAITSGQYGALTIASKTIFYITGILGSVLFVMSAEENHKKGDSRKQLRNAMLLTLLATIFSTIFFFLFPEFVLKVLFGNKYLNVSHYLGWFAIMVSLFSFVNLIIQYLLSINKVKSAFTFFAIAILEIILILSFGSSVFSIVGLVIGIQIIAIILGLFFIFKEKNYAQINITPDPSS